MGTIKDVAQAYIDAGVADEAAYEQRKDAAKAVERCRDEFTKTLDINSGCLPSWALLNIARAIIDAGNEAITATAVRVREL